MEFRTIVEIQRPLSPITPTSSVMFLGSCFSNAIGKHFIESMFASMSNPFGTLYNPTSIWQSLKMLSQGVYDFGPYLFKKEELWFSWLHSTVFYHPSRSHLLAKLQQGMEETLKFFHHTNFLFITWGTNRYYTLSEQNPWVVSNCHKFPANTFTEHQASVDEIVSVGEEVIREIIRRYPSMRIVITVSPFRYRKYGFHGNQLAKATLLLAANSLVQKFPDHVSYFPAYEIVNDELRDYRFYAEDNLHITPQAEDYIWERVKETMLDEKALLMVQRWNDILKRINHKPFNPQSNNYQTFLYKLDDDIRQFGEDYPQTDVTSHLNDIKIKMNRSL